MQTRGSQASPCPGTAKRILAACGIVPSSVRYLATGATSEAWDVRAGGQRYALRISALRPGKRNAYESEFAIRTRLSDLGGRVARPVCTDRDIDCDVSEAWSLDEFVDGTPGERGKLPAEACRDAGELLAMLHSLPVEGFGLLQNRRGELAGTRSDPREGILSRLERPWPFSGEPLDHHPIVAESPALVEKLRSREAALLDLLNRPSAVVHTDLHQGQLPLNGGRLAALLDFGDAAAGPAAWDIGSFGFFHGWEQTGYLLESYTDDSARRSEILADARLFAIVIALHHAARSVVLNISHRMAAAVRYLDANL